jgi:2-dehydro-3-deoxyphosphogluconate aldolase/(4S)-4-hydroxy-2-oxoglutarate aldolase
LTDNEFQDTLAAERVVAIIRRGSAAQAVDTAKALLGGGIRIVEVSLNTPGAVEAIAELASQYGDTPGTVIGAGTVLDATTVRRVAEAGARFFVSPVFDESAVTAASELGLAAVPGCLTPTEMLRAHQAGAAAVKVFPATEWTPGGLRNVTRAMPFLRLIPTGGVGVDDAADWLAAGAAGLGIGSALEKPGNVARLRENVAGHRVRELS